MSFALSDGRAARGLPGPVLALAASVALLAGASQAQAQSPSVYYICPGNVFTNTITSKEAEQRGCKAREAQQPTTIAGPKVKSPANTGSTTARSDGERVDSAEQKSRDTDARRILDSELRKEEAALDAMKREYNNGEPERHGDERNFQKYQDRVSELKAAITRKEADVAALRRELGKLPS